MPYCATFKKNMLSKKRRLPHKHKEAMIKFVIQIWDLGIRVLISSSKDIETVPAISRLLGELVC